MAAELGAAAAFDGRHDFQLTETDMPGVFTTPCRPKVAEDIRDLKPRPEHDRVLGGRIYLQGQVIEWAGDIA